MLGDASLAINLLAFAIALVGVWPSGTRLSRYADVISERAGLGSAFTGMLLLAGATSLPELATTVSAGVLGSAPLAVNNVLGGVGMQTAVLALADLIAVRGALTFFTPRAVLIVQGTLLVGLLALAAGAASAGELVTFFDVGLWSVLIFGVWAGSVWVIARYEEQRGWEPVNPPKEREDTHRRRRELRQDYEDVANRGLYLRFIGVALVIAGSGFVVASTAENIAEHTGLGAGFVGATLVALSTSLPELSTTVSAARVGAYSMAVSNIFGSNAMDVALLFAGDVAYRDGPIIDAAGDSAAFAASLGIVLTCLYVWGMLERKDRSVLRMGYDSAAVLVLYVAGVGVLYTVA